MRQRDKCMIKLALHPRMLPLRPTRVRNEMETSGARAAVPGIRPDFGRLLGFHGTEPSCGERTATRDTQAAHASLTEGLPEAASAWSSTTRELRGSDVYPMDAAAAPSS